MRFTMILAAALLLCTGCAAQNTLPPIENTEQVKDNRYTCMYEGYKYEYIADLPEQTKDAPLILVLHGYGSSADGFRNGVHLEKQANPLGYAVVYVTGGSGWNSGIAEEEKPDRDFLTELAHELQNTYSLDKKRTYAVGFSNGAFMTHRLAVEASDTFSACVSVCGMMPERIWNERTEYQPAGMFQITGETDSVVPKHSDGSAEHKNDPAIEDVMDYYADGLKQNAVETTERGSTLTKYGDGNRQVWHYFVKKSGHGWINREFDTNEAIMEYFEAMK